ncbi:MAG: hypothetical protein CMG41_00340 [Candidatus Marinimicrobia bacterium]|nr:hypothetical protein [Candidatus Neomarinimicrobiota bacterium]
MPVSIKRISTITLSIFCLYNLLFAMEVSETSFCGIEFEIKKNGFSNVSYILIHGDEETARMLLTEHIKENQGRAFFIKSKEREVPLGPTIVDPNRIFSKGGATKALKKFKPTWEQRKLELLLAELDDSRNEFLFNLFPSEGGLLIALHNNFRGYNVNNELENSQLYSLKKEQNPRDFIICTDLRDYKKLNKGPYNVVLQNVIEEKNNGSLSWAALENGVRYINIEVRLGWLSQQRKMLKYVEDVLRR